MKNEFDYLNDVKMDFGVYEKEIKKMKKGKKSIKKICLIAACAAAVAVTGTAFASGYVSRIVKTVSTGYNTFIQTDDSDVRIDIPEEFKGKFFDANGNEVEYFMGDMDYFDFYDENGVQYDEERLAQMFIDCGYADSTEISVSTAKENGGEIPESDESITVYTSQEDLQAVLNFELKAPEYLPDGWSFLYAEGFNTSTGTVSGDYAVLTYSDGKNNFTIHERVINENTKFETSTNGELKEGKINGYTAAITDNEIMWEQDGVSVYILSGRSDVTGDELLKVAKSIK